MGDWKFTQRETTEQLAMLHHFTFTKCCEGGREVEFHITVHEYVTPKDPAMPFFARADKELNQQSAPYTPSGWGRSLSEALSACLQQIRRFPYQPAERG